jgi:hypothetical protein
LAELEQALTAAAHIVLRYGDVYAPIMERLEREVEEARRRAESLERARRYAGTSYPHAIDDVPEAVATMKDRNDPRPIFVSATALCEISRDTWDVWVKAGFVPRPAIAHGQIIRWHWPTVEGQLLGIKPDLSAAPEPEWDPYMPPGRRGPGDEDPYRVAARRVFGSGGSRKATRRRKPSP